MPLPRWALALADGNSRSSSTDTALASVTSLPHLDERVLVAEAQTGNRAAFEELVRRYDRDVLHLALPHRHQRLPGPPAPPPSSPRRPGPGTEFRPFRRRHCRLF